MSAFLTHRTRPPARRMEIVTPIPPYLLGALALLGFTAANLPFVSAMPRHGNPFSDPVKRSRIVPPFPFDLPRVESSARSVTNPGPTRGGGIHAAKQLWSTPAGLGADAGRRRHRHGVG